MHTENKSIIDSTHPRLFRNPNRQLSFNTLAANELYTTGVPVLILQAGQQPTHTLLETKKNSEYLSKLHHKAGIAMLWLQCYELVFLLLGQLQHCFKFPSPGEPLGGNSNPVVLGDWNPQ